MTLTTPETPEAGRKTTEQVEQDTRKKLEEAKSKIDPKASAMELIQRFLKEYKSLTHQEKIQRLGAIIVTITLGNLFGLKPKADTVLGAGSDTKAPETEEPQQPQAAQKKEEPGKKSESQPALPPVDKEKYKKGDVIAALVGLYPGVEVQGAAQSVPTSVSKRNGVPKWNKKTTDSWDYAADGNTDEAMERGEYQIKAVDRQKLDHYTSSGTDQVPEPTKTKLVRIAELLRADSRMPLFTGIAMTVDGIQVMMVKEIHIHSMSEYGKRGLSDYYYQPHTGVSYIMKS